MENNTFEYVVPCHFGMEMPYLKEKLWHWDTKIVNVADGRVTL